MVNQCLQLLDLIAVFVKMGTQKKQKTAMLSDTTVFFCGAEGIRTPVQTRNQKAFYMFSF